MEALSCRFGHTWIQRIYMVAPINIVVGDELCWYYKHILSSISIYNWRAEIFILHILCRRQIKRKLSSNIIEREIHYTCIFLLVAGKVFLIWIHMYNCFPLCLKIKHKYSVRLQSNIPIGLFPMHILMFCVLLYLYFYIYSYAHNMSMHLFPLWQV